MRLSCLLFFIFFTQQLWAFTPSAAMGVEAGVARLSDDSDSVIGSSWAFHFEYNVDPIVSFFGQAGNSTGKDDDITLTQSAFSGGFMLGLLPVLEVRLGLSSTVTEADNGVKEDRERELGPLAGATVYIKEGVWKIGTSATVIKTGSMQSAAARMFLLIMF